ncbi:polysaccharide pyruvyl transferase family protein [Brachybacterium saurashtrense]|uniref:Polysaccharide pyruvyl transferase domain-containing protein n=1 Tax=Brachybacterium saurashtrense TaxID=556288 RepID=A0A345YQJ6_9MICO|nr:polysaccharide pyruvyl transferase family protein [Brachybacterium saurashtrense]AXK46198.1 hypothetical protein DWV08_11650 [Brachybacterium saurashtrense]RRR23938.1 hypothetical protein DXU92_03400 [Brachybacterium saurashtrense]
MKKIALVGYFGWGNFGDELFLTVHRQELGKKYDLFVANDLLEAPYFSRPVSEITDEADAVLIGGGDLLNPLRVSDLYWQTDFLRKPTYVYGLGVPNQPFVRERVLDHYRQFFAHENCKLVVARDEESYNWIKKNLNPGEKLTWYPDPVCAMARPEAKRTEKGVLGVVMREHRSRSQDLGHLHEAIETARGMGYRIRHIALATGALGEGDLALAKELSGPDDEVVHSESLEELCQEISKVELLATIKFHGLVVATMYGVPAIAMSVTPKNRNFLRMIERPEMLVSYTNEGLKDRIHKHPARIHQKVRAQLHRSSRDGYALLREKLEESIGE